MKRIMGFVDGENIVIRYQEMMKKGRTPKQVHDHIEDVFVWTPAIGNTIQSDLMRVTYYTTAVGTHDYVDEVSATIASTRFRSLLGPMPDGACQLIPRVFKKDRGSPKRRIVDIAITMDVMRAAMLTSVDGILLLTCDGDFAALAQEVARNTSKQIYVGSFSSGLSPALKTVADRFIDLDDLFFQ